MKLSLAWIFDHINGDWKDVDIDHLVHRFNTTTAEVEHFYDYSIELRLFSIGQVTEIKENKAIVFSTEWDKEFTFSHRPDAHPGTTFLITPQGWATLADFKNGKEGLFPEVLVTEHQMTGSWKDNVENEDIILEVDNKSITHRPDMWCHRGFAREIAALLDLKLKPIDTFITRQPVKEYEHSVPATSKNPFSIEIKNLNACKHYAGLYIPEIGNDPCILSGAFRLLRVDTRPINALVDATNYVMLDIGQPMHAFDAQLIGTKKIEVEFAQQGQRVDLLDGQAIELTNTDLIISDGKKPIALAGIMGGRASAINKDTESIFLEAATFDAAIVRRTSARLNKRTESSSRFEKSLDPYLNTVAIERFVRLLHEWGVTIQIPDPIVSIGRLPASNVIEISHSFIEAKLGLTISADQVRSILEKLECHVDEYEAHKNLIYKITIPTFRSTKDLTIKEDIVDEIARFYGYDKIPHAALALPMHVSSARIVDLVRTIKKQCAFGLSMHEVHNYSFYDEEFIRRIAYQPQHAVTVKNPVSENWKLLVTSLIPHLLKAVVTNETKQDELRFFEFGRTWQLAKAVNELKVIAGIFFNRKKEVDFYECKNYLISLCSSLKLSVEWVKASEPSDPWFDGNQTAYLMHNKKRVGVAGVVDTAFLHQVVPGYAFVWELDRDFLESFKPATIQYQPVSKYPEVWLDISMLTPVTVTVEKISSAIHAVDKRIVDVRLIDFFEKEEWAGKRSVTFRYYIKDYEKTLEKEEIEKISNAVVASVTALGASIR